MLNGEHNGIDLKPLKIPSDGNCVIRLKKQNRSMSKSGKNHFLKHAYTVQLPYTLWFPKDFSHSVF